MNIAKTRITGTEHVSPPAILVFAVAKSARVCSHDITEITRFVYKDSNDHRNHVKTTLIRTESTAFHVKVAEG